MYYLLLIIPIFIFYPLYLIDFIATIITNIFCFCKNINRYKTAKNNIKKVFPELSELQRSKIIYSSTKVTIMNIMIGLMGKLLYKFTYFRNSVEFNIPNSFYNDISTNGVLLLGCHNSLWYSTLIFIGEYCKRNFLIVIIYKKYVNNLLYPKNFYKNMKFSNKNDPNSINLLNLSRKEILIMLCDQHSGSGYSNINFLNHQVKFHKGPEIIQKKTKRIIWILNHSYRNYKIYINIYKMNLDSNKSITQNIADEFNKIILNNPNEYLWMYNRFK